jgi:sigma-B regulation protein RsbU (phosphoserine phosphatase)
MAKEVGGDFYMVKRLDDRRVLLCLCDVSGKGIAASLVTAVLGGIFDTYTAVSSLQVFLKGLNRYIIETFQLRYFDISSQAFSLSSTPRPARQPSAT